MTQTQVQHQLETLIRAAFAEGRCGAYYLVDLEISPSGRVAAYVDGDEGVSLDACAQVSRTLQAVLDAEPGLETLYALEVSSPGVSRPLKFLRQYPKHIGRSLRVELTDDRKIEGTLKATGPNEVILEVAPRQKKTAPEQVRIPFDTIAAAYVLIQFGK